LIQRIQPIQPDRDDVILIFSVFFKTKLNIIAQYTQKNPRNNRMAGMNLSYILLALKKEGIKKQTESQEENKLLKKMVDNTTIIKFGGYKYDK